MQVFLCLFYANEKFCVLKGSDELDRFDQYLIEHFQNEAELRQSEEFSGLIQTFKRNNKSYIDKISRVSQKEGRILYLYQDETLPENIRGKRYYHLTPVYGEDAPKSETLSDMIDRVFAKLRIYESPGLLTDHVLEDCSFLFRRSLDPVFIEEMEILRTKLRSCSREMYEKELDVPCYARPFHDIYSKLLDLIGMSVGQTLDQYPLDAYFKLRKIDESVMKVVNLTYPNKNNLPVAKESSNIAENFLSEKDDRDEIEIADPVDFFERVRRQREIQQQQISGALEDYRKDAFSSAFAQPEENKTTRGISDLLLDYYEILDREFSGEQGQAQLLSFAEEFPDLFPCYSRLKCLGALPAPRAGYGNKKVFQWQNGMMMIKDSDGMGAKKPIVKMKK